jgi:5-methyltetrahydrofolate--homocysteine methyltransferase
VAAGAAMQAAMEILQQEIARKGQKQESKGRVLIGTVAGDVHDIGKNMVATLIRAAGFEVIDLGVNIGAREFADAVEKHAPDILALSALMTTTLMEQKKVIESLKASGLRDRVKIMVGGAAVTQEFSDRIGADGYESTAPRAAELALRWVTR